MSAEHETPEGYDLDAPPDAFGEQEPPCIECGGWHVMTYCSNCHEIACQNCQCEHDGSPEDDSR